MTTTAHRRTVAEMGSAAELDAIMADLDATGAAWEAAGYGYGTPEDEAREAVFARLKAWNSARETWTGGSRR